MFDPHVEEDFFQRSRTYIIWLDFKLLELTVKDLEEVMVIVFEVFWHTEDDFFAILIYVDITDFHSLCMLTEECL